MLPVYSEFYKDSASYTVLYSVCTVMHIYNIITFFFYHLIYLGKKSNREQNNNSKLHKKTVLTYQHAHFLLLSYKKRNTKFLQKLSS